MNAALRSKLDRYATLFNRRDWDGVRALVGAECALDVVSKSQRRGKEVRMYFDRYEREDVSLRVARVDGELALAAFVAGAPEPAYFVVLAWDGDQVASIRDFRYVPYIATEAAVELLDG